VHGGGFVERGARCLAIAVFRPLLQLTTECTNKYRQSVKLLDFFEEKDKDTEIG